MGKSLRYSVLEDFSHNFVSYYLEIFDMTGSYAASYLPWILIPVVTWLMPAVVMGLLFIYIESEQ